MFPFFFRIFIWGNYNNEKEAHWHVFVQRISIRKGKKWSGIWLTTKLLSSCFTSLLMAMWTGSISNISTELQRLWKRLDLIERKEFSLSVLSDTWWNIKALTGAFIDVFILEINFSRLFFVINLICYILYSYLSLKFVSWKYQKLFH